MKKKLSIIICALLLSLGITSSARRGRGRGFHGGHRHYNRYHGNWHRHHDGGGAAFAIPAIIGTVAATAAAVSEAEAEKRAYEDACYDDVYVDDDYELED